MRRCIDAIQVQDVAPAEIVCVDSGSTDGTLPMLLKHLDVAVIHIPPESFGYGSALNTGCQAARSPIIVSLSQWSVPSTVGWLRELVEPLNDPTVGAVHSRQYPCATASEFERQILFWRHSMAHQRLFGFLPGRNPEGYSNASSAFRRSLWERHPFRDDGPDFEDIEFAREITADGWRITYAPSSQVCHSHARSLAWYLGRDMRHRIGWLEGVTA